MPSRNQHRHRWRSRHVFVNGGCSRREKECSVNIIVCLVCIAIIAYFGTLLHKIVDQKNLYDDYDLERVCGTFNNRAECNGDCGNLCAWCGIDDYCRVSSSNLTLVCFGYGHSDWTDPPADAKCSVKDYDEKLAWYITIIVVSSIGILLTVIYCGIICCRVCCCRSENSLSEYTYSTE